MARVRAGTKQVVKMEGRTDGSKAVARKGAKGKRRVAREKTRTGWTCGKTGDIAAWCRKRGSKHLFAIDEDDSETSKNQLTTKEHLQAWCVLEESETEQWHEVISRRDKQRAKKVNQASLLNVENSHTSSQKKIVEVKDG